MRVVLLAALWWAIPGTALAQQDTGAWFMVPAGSATVDPIDPLQLQLPDRPEVPSADLFGGTAALGGSGATALPRAGTAGGSGTSCGSGGTGACTETGGTGTTIIDTDDTDTDTDTDVPMDTDTDTEPEGCSNCATGGSPASGAWALPLLAAVLLRRRQT